MGATRDWPACGSHEWARLREVALRKVVARLASEGLLDAIAVPPVTVAGNVDGDGTKAGEDDNPDPRVDVQVYRAMIRRGERNPKGWFRGVDRNSPYRVIARWAAETCPGVPTGSLVKLLDALRDVRWWDDDGHIIGGEMLRALEAELEEGFEDEQWMLVVSDFEAAVGRLRSVFERLCLL